MIKNCVETCLIDGNESEEQSVMLYRGQGIVSPDGFGRCDLEATRFQESREIRTDHGMLADVHEVRYTDNRRL